MTQHTQYGDVTDLVNNAHLLQLVSGWLCRRPRYQHLFSCRLLEVLLSVKWIRTEAGGELGLVPCEPGVRPSCVLTS